MSSRAFFAGIFVSVLVACGSACGANEDCGSATCGACQEGFVNSDRCEDGEWVCDCVPRTATSVVVDGGNDAAASPDAPEAPAVPTCQQKLASPTASGVCPADEWDQPCEQGCLSCRCTGGTWGPCTTNPACFDGGSD
jgi:hypothetical protein